MSATSRKESISTPKCLQRNQQIMTSQIHHFTTMPIAAALMRWFWGSRCSRTTLRATFSVEISPSSPAIPAKSRLASTGCLGYSWMDVVGISRIFPFLSAPNPPRDILPPSSQDPFQIWMARISRKPLRRPVVYCTCRRHEQSGYFLEPARWGRRDTVMGCCAKHETSYQALARYSLPISYNLKLWILRNILRGCRIFLTSWYASSWFGVSVVFVSSGIRWKHRNCLTENNKVTIRVFNTLFCRQNYFPVRDQLEGRKILQVAVLKGL